MGKNATLVCNEEAFPEGLKYWERKDGRVIEKSDKYEITIKEVGDYRVS